MANVLIQKTRHLVPSFRRFTDTVALGELDPAGTRRADPLRIDFQSRAAEWRLDPTVGLAGDIVSAALVSGETTMPEVRDAASFILAHPEVSSSSLIAAAGNLLSEEDSTSGYSDLLPRLTTFLEENSRQKSYRRIRELKEAAVRFGPNPIRFAELARLYLILGNGEKAKHNIALALNLAPTNRYVLRSAARLYAHCEDSERAFELLRRNPSTRHDPWLASAELAMAGLIGKPGKVVKTAANLLTSGRYSPSSLAELRAGVGSVELLNGNRRASKRLLQASLEKPNDNALAQVEWALSQDPMFDVTVSAFDVRRNYEALALEAFNQQQWLNVLRHCESWFMDMPFASRPVLLASHVATVALEDFASAQLFCQAGRVASPDDPLLVNNYAYALGLNNEPDKALKVLDEVTRPVPEIETHICLQATRGLAYFRSGRLDEGRLLYTAAMAAAQETPNVLLWQLSLLNYVREELLAQQPLPISLAKKVREMKVHSRAFTVQILRTKVVALLDTRIS